MKEVSGFDKLLTGGNGLLAGVGTGSFPFEQAVTSAETAITTINTNFLNFFISSLVLFLFINEILVIQHTQQYPNHNNKYYAIPDVIKP